MKNNAPVKITLMQRIINYKICIKCFEMWSLSDRTLGIIA